MYQIKLNKTDKSISLKKVEKNIKLVQNVYRISLRQTGRQGPAASNIIKSVFGRTGDIVAEANDYAADQVSYDDTVIATISGGTVTGDDVQEILDNFVSVFAPYVTTLFARVPPSGGTAGQVLAKETNTSYDYVWADQAGGDSVFEANANVITPVDPDNRQMYIGGDLSSSLSVLGDPSVVGSVGDGKTAAIAIASYGTGTSTALVGFAGRGTLDAPTGTKAGDQLFFFGAGGTLLNGNQSVTSGIIAGFLINAEQDATNSTLPMSITINVPNGAVIKGYASRKVAIGSSSQVPEEQLLVTGAVELQNKTAPTGRASYGKLYSSSVDGLPHFVDQNGVDYTLVIDTSGFVPDTRTINGQDLSANRTFTQDDIGDGATYKQYSDTEKTKLAGIEAGADVTDATNVAAAGAFMKSTDDTDDITDTATNRFTNDTDITRLANTSGTNTGDQTLSGLGGVPTTRTINGYDLSADRTLVKGDVGLGNVDNTSDATKNSAVATLTFKRITKRVYTTASTATLTPEKDTYDLFHITALAGALNVANHSTTTPADGDQIQIRLLDDGTARAITWDTNYVAKGGIPLPSTTVLGKNLELGFEWNSNLGKFNLLALAQET